MIRLTPVALVLGICSVGLLADEPAEQIVNVPTIQLHRIRVVDAQQVLGLLKPLVPDTHVAVVPEQATIVVFATPSVHESIASAIAEHEQTALLFERVKLAGADPNLVQQLVRSGRRAAQIDQASKLDSFRMEFDRFAGDATVWGTAVQIDFVKQAIEALADRTDRTAATASSPATGRKAPVEPRHVTEQRVAGNEVVQDRRDQRGSLLAPEGPIQIVPIEGLDLLLIRGQRTDVERLFGQ